MNSADQIASKPSELIFRLYRRPSLQVNSRFFGRSRFSAVFDVYKMYIPLHRSNLNVSAEKVKKFLYLPASSPKRRFFPGDVPLVY